MKMQWAYVMIGAALFGYFGRRVGDVPGIGSGHLFAFSVGLVFLGQAASVGLVSRVRRLEEELSAMRPIK